MVVDDVDFRRSCVGPAENDAPFVVDSDAVKPACRAPAASLYFFRPHPVQTWSSTPDSRSPVLSRHS